MSIISQETFEKFTEEEKEGVRKLYEHYEDDALLYQTEPPKLVQYNLEALFGEENLQPKPEIRTWVDVPLRGETVNVMIDEDHNIILLKRTEFSEKIFKKLIATARIAKLIELGYGGMVSKKEYTNNGAWQIVPYRDAYDEPFKLKIVFGWGHKTFISFKEEQQAEEFMSYPENLELVKQYYMI